MHELTVCVPQSYRQVLCAGECQRCVYAHHRLSDHFSISISPHTSFPSIWIQYTSTYGGYSRVVIILVKSITDICQHYSGPHCTLGDDIMAPFWVIVFLQVLGSYQCYEHLYVCEHEVPYRSSNSSPHLSMIVRERWSTMGGWGHGAASITVPQCRHKAVNWLAIARVGRLYYARTLNIW